MSILKMSPIMEHVRVFDVKPGKTHSLQAAIIAWVFHTCNTSQLRVAIKGCVKDDPQSITDAIVRMRHDYDIYVWKLRALQGVLCEHYLQGAAESKMCKRLSIPNIEQPVNIKDAEALLGKALRDITPVLVNLARLKVKFVADLYQGSPIAVLKARAVMTFRWQYPFMRNPGASLNTAVRNYANNICRDNTTKARQIYIGDHTKGERKHILTSLKDDAASDLEDYDLRLDWENLSPTDKSVIYIILNQFEGPPDRLVPELAAIMRTDEARVQASVERITTYLQEGGEYEPVSFNLNVF
jgi:hypothetical protein